MFACTFSFAPFVLAAVAPALDVSTEFAGFEAAAFALTVVFALAAASPVFAFEFVFCPAEQPTKSAAAASKSESVKCLFTYILLLIYRAVS
jgi:hypothetical protein